MGAEPGRGALEDAAEYPRLKAYVQGVVGAFANDDRILGMGSVERAGQRRRREL